MEYIYTLLIIIIIIYIALPNSNSKVIGTCLLENSTDNAKIVAQVYKSIVAFIALLITIPFLVYGIILLLTIGTVPVNTSGHKQLLIKFTAVTITCSVALIAQCALLLYTSFASDQNISTVGALIAVIILEIIPGWVLMTTVRVPDERKGIFAFLWCIPVQDGTGSTSKLRFFFTRTSSKSNIEGNSSHATTDRISNNPSNNDL